MLTHTFRKTKQGYIVTLSGKFWLRVQQSRPEAVSLMLSKLSQDLKGYGKSSVLSHAQMQTLLTLWGADANGRWTSRFSTLTLPALNVQQHFVHGLLTSPAAPADEVLDRAELFYDLLATLLPTE